VLTPPDGLPDDVLVRVLGDGWRLAVASIDYRAVGFGSHHWEVVDLGESRWFVTVDELEARRHSATEPVGAAFQRLRAALRTAVALRGTGCSFVVAPTATVDGAPLIQIDARFAVALYPYIDGQSFAWGEFSSPAHRRGVLDLIVDLHEAPRASARHALVDDFAIPRRDELELGFHPSHDLRESGPFASRTSALILDNATRIQQLLGYYDDLVNETRRRSRPTVLTHGEPHPGNTMLTSDGWMLIDWDTVLVAPPERDLWSLDPGDGSIIEAYVQATGTTPLPPMLALYRLRWDLTDIALFVSRLRGQHAGSSDDEMSWDNLRSLVSDLPAAPTAWAWP
jgi:hypothetical protein